MTKNQNRRDYERQKHDDNIKYLYFSRYLMVRYIIVIFLFINLFWLLILLQYRKSLGIIVAGVMTCLAAMAAIEQLSKMHNHKADVPVTRNYLWLQLVANLLLMGLVFLPVQTEFFPFVTTNSTRYLLVGVLLIGIILSYLSERRIRQIINERDKYVKVIETFEKN